MHVVYEPIGENACLLTLGHDIDMGVNARVHALAETLRRADITGTQDIVPAYAGVLLRHGLAEADAVTAWHRQVRDTVTAMPEDAGDNGGTLHELDACYDGEDLEQVARACRLSVREVVERHTQCEYRVAMIGFAPGFPYLIGMDPQLATPRHKTPRTHVPAGSVAIGGQQTGIYPRSLPGGWQLIGRTDACLFDPDHDTQPCLLLPGDRVRFRAVDAQALQATKTPGDGAC